jgi:hypothetical protein
LNAKRLQEGILLFWIDLIAARAKLNSRPVLDSKPHLAEDLLRNYIQKHHEASGYGGLEVYFIHI